MGHRAPSKTSKQRLRLQVYYPQIFRSKEVISGQPYLGIDTLAPLHLLPGSPIPAFNKTYPTATLHPSSTYAISMDKAWYIHRKGMVNSWIKHGKGMENHGKVQPLAYASLFQLNTSLPARQYH